MVTNLPAEAKAKWLKAMEAKTPEEKIRALEEFLSAVPKHKGTERLVKFVRRRIAELRRELELRRVKERAARGGGGQRFYVDKSGDVQVVVFGPPSSGKTSVIRELSNTQLEPDDVPFSTSEPVPAMFVEGGVYIQLVKAPSMVIGDPEAWFNAATVALARNADAAYMVLDATRDAAKDLAFMLELFESEGINLARPRAIVRIERRHAGGIQIIGRLIGATQDDVRRLLAEYGIHHATVYIDGEATLDDVEDAVLRQPRYLPTIAIITKTDLADPGPVEEALAKLGIPYVRAPGIDRRALMELTLRMTRRIRVYTKEVHAKEPSDKPLVVPEGSTVGDVARMIHSRLYRGFRYAVVWRRETYPAMPKRVGMDYVLSDGDVIEIHAV